MPCPVSLPQSLRLTTWAWHAMPLRMTLLFRTLLVLLGALNVKFMEQVKSKDCHSERSGNSESEESVSLALTHP